jgi:hypothetical protein
LTPGEPRVDPATTPNAPTCSLARLPAQSVRRRRPTLGAGHHRLRAGPTMVAPCERILPRRRRGSRWPQPPLLRAALHESFFLARITVATTSFTTSRTTPNASSSRTKRCRQVANALFVCLISHQPTILFSQNKPAITNQPAILFSQNKSEQTSTSHQPPAERTG